MRQWEVWSRYAQLSREGQLPEDYEGWRRQAEHHATLRFEELVERGAILVGTPDTVLRMVGEHREKLDLLQLLVSFRYGGMSYDMAERSMGLFASEVMPKLRT